MKGSNELRLNGATLIEALQEYFDKRYAPKIKVISVEQAPSPYGNEFSVKVESVSEPTT